MDGQHTREAAIKQFEEQEPAIGPVYNMADLFEDPHFAARDGIRTCETEDDGIAMRGVFPKLSEMPGEIDHPEPELGDHARAVLRERVGLTDDEIDSLLAEGVTAVAETD